MNFYAIKNNILKGDEADKVTVHTERKIKGKHACGRVHIVTAPEDKMYRVSFLRQGV